MNIHPTAIIDKNAELDENITIGPFSIIEGDVKIGSGTIIESCVRIHSGTRMGKNNHIFHSATIGGVPQDLGFKPEIKSFVEIGDSNIIREGFVFHKGSKEGNSTKIGNHNYLMGNGHLAHDVQFGDHNIMVQNTIIAGHVKISNRVFISGLVGVHQFCHVGDYAMLAGCAKIVKDVPPFTLIDGNPATIIGLNSVALKRSGFSAESREKIKNAYKIIYHSGMNVSTAIKKLKEENDPDENVQKIIKFIEESDRGITDHR
jgi:UDP-N-acetylglucosamine acyltransferase